jgi:hypothetical protein
MSRPCCVEPPYSHAEASPEVVALARRLRLTRQRMNDGKTLALVNLAEIAHKPKPATDRAALPGASRQIRVAPAAVRPHQASATDALPLPLRESGIHFCAYPMPTLPPGAGLTSGHAKGFSALIRSPRRCERAAWAPRRDRGAHKVGVSTTPLFKCRVRRAEQRPKQRSDDAVAVEGAKCNMINANAIAQDTRPSLPPR